ncbi:hypothetical protein ALC56_02077, partial [Trachymyrmex septentrionalis]
VIVEKIKRFCRRSGNGNSILRSNLPGRSNAGSNVSALQKYIRIKVKILLQMQNGIASHAKYTRIQTNCMP